MTNLADQTSESSPAAARWRVVGRLDPRSLGGGRSLALNIVQWPARIANSYVEGSSWAERICLEWQMGESALVTRSFDRGLAVGLDIATLQMWFLEKCRRVPHTFDPDGRSPAEAEAWILVELLHRAVEPTRFSKALPYASPDLITGDDERYSPGYCTAELSELSAWYHDAALSFRAYAEESGAAAPLVVCNPQDLNLSCQLELSSGQASRRVIELGFSSGGLAIDEPFFYVKATEGRCGASAVMRATAIAVAPAPRARLASFLSDAISELLKSTASRGC
jgi:hypothetical protein